MAKFLNKILFQNKELYLLYLKENPGAINPPGGTNPDDPTIPPLNDNPWGITPDDLLYDQSTLPYISSRYIQPTWNINDEVVLDLYSCDYYQTDFLCEPQYYQDFTLLLNMDEKGVTEYPIKSGDLHFNIGKIPEGEHYFTAQVRDKDGRYSHEIYEEFRVINTVEYEQEIVDNTYYVTQEDLAIYGIRNDDNEENALATKQGLQRLMDDKSKEGVRKLVLLPGTYQIEAEIEFERGFPENATEEEKMDAYWRQIELNTLSVPNRFILDLNTSNIRLKTTPRWMSKSSIIIIDNKYDSHIINGKMEGDYRRKDLTPSLSGTIAGEGGTCCSIRNKSRYSSIENIDITLFTGYCCSFYLNEVNVDYGRRFNNFTEVVILNDGTEQYKKDFWTSDYFEVPSRIINSKTVLIGKSLGYASGVKSDSWNVDYHCYDENKNLIKTIHGFQYREFIKPSETRFIRCTYYCKTTEDRPDPNSYLSDIGLLLIDYNKPRNCDFKNLRFNDTRTCGLNPNQANNCLIEGCTFTDCAKGITPVSVDFEDGWYLMQDYMFRNNEVLVPIGTADLVTNAGINLIFRNNKNFRFIMQGDSGVGMLFENNIDTKRLVFSRKNRLEYQYTMIRNENFKNGTLYWRPEYYDKIIARNFNFFESQPPKIPGDGYYINAMIDNNNQTFDNPIQGIDTPAGKYFKSTIKNYTGWKARTKMRGLELVHGTFEGFDGKINNDNIFINCKIDNFKLSYDEYNTSLKIENSTINIFHSAYVTYTFPNITYEITNCIIDNSLSPYGIYIFTGNFKADTSLTKTFIFKNCTFKNGTKIAIDDTLNNTNITWILENNTFE